MADDGQQRPVDPVEHMARTLCNDLAARVIAEQVEADAYDECREHVQDYWRALARAAISRPSPPVDRLREVLRMIAETRWDFNASVECLTYIQTEARKALAETKGAA